MNLQGEQTAIHAEQDSEQATPGELADSPEGFGQFYELIYGRSLPAHALRDWVRPLYAAREAEKGLVAEAFRGSTKTTTLTIAFMAFRIGQEPHKSNLLIQCGDKAASDTAQQIGDLIEHNPGWMRAFPNVMPDKEVTWGDNGFEVRRSDVGYEEWRAKCAREKGKDPTLVGLGYRSSAIIGKHPTGMLVVDDIHDEGNTRSIIELDTVVTILTGTILPTVTPQTWQVIVGTPWTQEDCLARLKATDRFVSVKTPIFKRRDEAEGESGDATATGDGPHVLAMNRQEGKTDEAEEREPVWPEKYPHKEIYKVRQLVGEAEFARMFLLDLTLAEGMHLKKEWLNKYPFRDVAPGWPVVMGVDYASASDKLKGQRRDYFAVAVGRAIPGGGIIVVDGFRGHVTQGEAENKLITLASYYPTLETIGVEAVGKGEEFFQLVLRNTWLPLVALHPGKSSKAERFENGMALAFQRGKAWIADLENPFLNRFRYEWMRWPHGDHDDVLDAVYWMLFAGQHHLAGALPLGRPKNPFAGLGRN